MTTDETKEAFHSTPSKTESHSKKEKKDSSRRRPTKPKEWYAPMAVLLISVLLAFGGGRYIRASIHEWVDRNIRGVVSNSSSESGNPESPPTRIWTITPNSTGLKMDAAIYEEFLGSKTSMLEEGPPVDASAEVTMPYCVYIFLEVTPKTARANLHPDWVSLANPKSKDPTGPACRVMAMANTDQFTTDVFEMPHLELILCKTRQCVSWVQQKQQDRETKIPILYTGFTSRPPPLVVPTTEEISEERFHRFLHVAGQSPHKGTWTILQAWIQHPHWPPITITSYKNAMIDTILPQMLQQFNLPQLPSNIRHLNTQLPRDELDRLMHSHGVHLCLSGMEGFGHYLNEARAVGALTLATNYPAMNELIREPDGGILLEPTNLLEWTNGLSFANVGAPELARVMNQVVLPMTIKDRNERGNRAKEAFDRDREAFRLRMRKFQCYIDTCRDLQSLQSCAKDSCGLDLE